jgi:hypothetical protein
MVLVAGFAPLQGTCQRPLPWQVAECRAREKAILDATVRLTIHGWIEIEDGTGVTHISGTISHATVIDGRYLLTHNHFGLPLSQVLLYNGHASGGFTGVSICRADGTVVLDQAPLESFVVAEEWGESLLLDFGEVAGQGFFTHAGVDSASAASAGTLWLVPGMEVAQVDWDRQGHTRVEWATVQAMRQEDGLPLLRVDHFIELGASGGGVFLDGRHIGNNWGRITETNLDTGAVRQALTLVALNP